jgi:drug/metabolite transporter (DMT)-like permease
MGASLLLASIALAPAAAIHPPATTPSSTAIVAIVVLGLFCTAAAFVFFGMLIAEAGPGRAAVITYVAPVVAVALGVTILGERPGVGAAAGLLLILAGSWLSTDGRLPPGLQGVLSRGPRTRRRSPAPSDSRVSRGSPPSPDPSPAGSS